MGRALLVARLAARNIRHHPVEAALLVLAIMAATTTLTVGRVLDGVTDSPYERTREATAGPDVIASLAPEPISPDSVLPVDPDALADLEALADAPGVADHSGPFPATPATLEAGGVTAGAWAEGRDTAEASVEQPRLTEGTWVEDGGAVVEAAFADALDVGAGDEVTLNGRSFRVVGVAVTAAASYTDVCFGTICGPLLGVGGGDSPPPRGGPVDASGAVDVDVEPLPRDPGLVWLTRDDARALAPADEAMSHVLNLRLADPAAADAFVEAHSATSTGGGGPFLAAWTDVRTTYDEFVRDTRQALAAFGGLLTVLAIASVAVLVGGRLADQTRRVGLLKAVGGTPGLVAVVLLAEYLALAVVAAAAGLTVGWLAAPLLSDPGAGLLGGAGTPTLTLSTVVVVTAVALGVAIAASAVSAWRAARTSTVRALSDAARRPRRARRLIALSARLPVSLLLGLRVLARRPRRVLLGLASVVVTVSGIVAILGARAAMAADREGAASLDPTADRADQILFVITAILVALAAVNAVVITWAAALDSRQSLAVARALGATPRQVSVGLSAAQVLPAAVGAVLGVPAGLALWASLADGDGATPSTGQLIAVVAGTALVVALLTAVPARLGARRPAAEVLRAEHA